MLKVLDIAIKDLVRATRSLFLIGMTMAAPLLITGLIYLAFGSMTGGDVSLNVIKVGLVNADTLPANSALSTSIGANIRAMFFDESVKAWITARDYADEAAARAALNAQEIGAAVLIPANFSAETLAGAPASPIVILQDPTLSIGPSVVKEMVGALLDGVAGGGITYRVVSARLAANGQTLSPTNVAPLLERYSTWYADFQRALFHTPATAALVLTTPAAGDRGESPLQAMMGLVMAGQMVFFSFFTGAYGMMSILQESEEGTLARMFTTPTDRTLILTGKFLAVFLMVIIQGVVLMVAAQLLFRVQWGRWDAAALSLLGQMLASTGLGVLLVAFIKTSQQAGPIFGGALTGLGMLSGLFTTNIDLPAAFTALANFTPQGWVLKAWKLTLAGQPAAELLLPCAVLVAMGLGMFAIGALLFRRRYA